MKIIGLTGGIGSGKSKALVFFKEKGIPCYQADKAGHRVLNEDKDVIEKVKTHFGANLYTEKGLDRNSLGAYVFKNPEALAYLNSIVHPAVRKDFKEFMQEQQAPFVISEVAILFENGGQAQYDKIILITAPELLRIKRVQERDQVSEEEIRARIKKQWPDSKKASLADYVVTNAADWSTTETKLQKVYEDLLVFSQQ